ncbi:MAG: FeoC-like transcriptional regulator [Pseudomonadota bacterium]
MILRDIKNYLQQRRQASLTDIALHLDADPAAVEGMLEQWIRKGKVHKTTLTTSCGSSCNQCDSAESALYVWGEEPAIQPVAWLPRNCKG